MRKDDHLIFEALQNKGVAVHIADHVVNEKEGTAGKQRLKYDYEWATAFLPRDIDISNKAGQDKVLSLAYDEVLRRIVHDRKNPRLAARNMFYDEDFPMEIVSQYAHYQKHGFPDASEDGWYASENAEDAEDSAEDKLKNRENERDEKRRDAEVSAAFHYDPMPGLEKTANQIRDLLQGAANDEARTEHIIKMAQTILGSPEDYYPAEYRKMLDGLIVLLNRFIVVPMN